MKYFQRGALSGEIDFNLSSDHFEISVYNVNDRNEIFQYQFKNSNTSPKIMMNKYKDGTWYWNVWTLG